MRRQVRLSRPEGRLTLGIWLGPTLAVIVAALGTRWLGWFQPRSRRRIALRRIAERLAQEDSAGYDHKYERFLEHYLGGRDWRDEWGKPDTPAERTRPGRRLC